MTAEFWKATLTATNLKSTAAKPKLDPSAVKESYIQTQTLNKMRHFVDRTQVTARRWGGESWFDPKVDNELQIEGQKRTSSHWRRRASS